ncbi:translation initiation factor eIF3 subunit-domain-containing protein [Entophlyctis helioformis]|nr:translation initiation factor eIF3 subunit-domain-containing protein [Entophlyctis helioformis]
MTRSGPSALDQAGRVLGATAAPEHPADASSATASTVVGTTVPPPARAIATTRTAVQRPTLDQLRQQAETLIAEINSTAGTIMIPPADISALLRWHMPLHPLEPDFIATAERQTRSSLHGHLAPPVVACPMVPFRAFLSAHLPVIKNRYPRIDAAVRSRALMNAWREQGESEDEEREVVLPTAKAAAATPASWDDEDAEDGDVKDSWDASDDDEEKKPAPKSPASTTSSVVVPPKKKKTLAQKLAEKKEEEERRKQELAERAAKAKEEADQDAGESAADRKARLARSVMESDLENAKALLGDLAAVGGIPPAQGAIESLHPKSRGDFDDFVKVVMKKFSTFESMPQYSYFVEALMRDMVVSLNVDDTRRISSSLTAMINEKQRVLKEQQAKGKKKAAAKVALKAAPSGDRDTTNYDGRLPYLLPCLPIFPNAGRLTDACLPCCVLTDYDDFDDFM